MPYLTPETLPEERDCRALLIPASSEWLAIVSGALTELLATWNWAQQGAVTVPEAIAAMTEMVNTYYDGCQPCTITGGYPILRLNTDGELEELNGDGEFVPATGDYVFPPPPAREGGSPEDQICLASKNAANILQLAYEQITDSFADGLTEAEAYIAFIAWVLATFGAETVGITIALAFFFLVVFQTLYAVVQYVTADLWDSTFTQQLVCLLQGCATNDAGVVTFDWDCFWSDLAAQTNAFDLTSDQLRLYAQIMFILQVLGGVGALNAAGATTAITDDDCSFCASEWVIGWGFCGAMDDWSIWHSCGNLTADGIEQVDDCEGEPSLASADLVYDFGSSVIETATLYVTDDYAPNSNVKVYAGAPGSLSLIYDAANPSVPVVLTGLSLTGNVEFLWLWNYSGSGHRDLIQGAWFTGTGATPAIGTPNPDPPPCYIG